jgi:hypothetical protein
MALGGGARRLLTLGEAADLAGVALLDMRAAIRAGELPTRAGVHVGHAIDLVALDDLQRVFPGARGKRPSGPGLAARGIEADTGAAAGGAPPDLLADELDALCEQVRAAKEQNERLFGELGETDGELRQLCARLQHDGEARLEQERRMAEGQRAIDAALESLRRARVWATTSTLGLVVLAGALAMSSWRPAAGRAGAPPEPARLARAVADGADPGRADPYVAADAESPSPAPGDAEVALAAAPAVTETRDALVGAPDGAPDGAPRATGPACSYHALTGRGQELRDVLGPCLGPWDEDAGVVVGVHRFAGAPYCQHHLVVPRDLGGSIARAREVARLAREESLWPPLVQLRLDRPAAGFLKRAVSSWIESGFEHGDFEEHRWTAADALDTYTLESWVRVAEVADLARVRRFRMWIAVDDGPRGDRLLDFVWLE